MIDTGSINPKSKGKILQLDYDFITSLEGECMYCLTDAQVQIILGMLDYIAWPTRWFSESGTVDYDTILSMQGNLGRTLMSGCCDDPVLATRIDPATGKILVTHDGVTWLPAEDEGLDPRYTAPILPPLPDAGDEDNRCRSATNVVGAVQDKVEDFGTTLGTYGSILALASAIALAIVGVFATGATMLPVIIPIVIALAQAIYDIASEDYLGLFSGGVYDDLQCILYCNCGTDGTFSEQNVLDILTAIDSTFIGNVALTFTSTIKAWQVPGINAAARGGSLSTGDCSDCSCNPDEWCWEYDFTDNDGGFIINTYGEYVVGVGWRTTLVSGIVQSLIAIKDYGDEFLITGGEVDVVFSAGGGGSGEGSGCNVTVLRDEAEMINERGIPSGTYDWSFDDPQAMSEVTMNPSCGNTGGGQTATITRLKMWGTGASPEGSSNCSPG